MKLQTPLDKYNKDVIKKHIITAVAKGKTFKEIADDLTEMLGEKITEAMVQYFYYREVEAKVQVHRQKIEQMDTEDFDLERELIWLYKIQKKRIAKWVSLEEQAGLPFPETNKNIDVAARVLEKLANIKMKLGEEKPDRIIEDLLMRLEEVEDAGKKKEKKNRT